MPTITKAQIVKQITDTITLHPRARHAVWTPQQAADLKAGGYWPLTLQGATLQVANPANKRDDLKAMLARVQERVTARTDRLAVHRWRSGHGWRKATSYRRSQDPWAHAKAVAVRRTAKASRKANRH